MASFWHDDGSEAILMSQERDLQKMNDGYMAAQAEAAFGGIIEDTIHQTMVRMIALYRGGEYTHDQLIGHVAEISALDSLLSSLEAKQRVAIKARQKELGNASQA